MYVNLCKFGVNLIFQLFAESKDEVGLVLFGTEGTANHLSDDGYENITEARPVAPVDLDLIKYIKTELQPGPQSADCILYIFPWKHWYIYPKVYVSIRPFIYKCIKFISILKQIVNMTVIVMLSPLILQMNNKSFASF